MKLVNLCPHPISLRHPDGTETVIPSEGNARVSVNYRQARTIELGGHAVPVIEGKYGDVAGLPEPVGGCIYIVSHMVRMALPKRADLWSPADMIRDASGTVVACRMFEATMQAEGSA